MQPFAQHRSSSQAASTIFPAQSATIASVDCLITRTYSRETNCSDVLGHAAATEPNLSLAPRKNEPASQPFRLEVLGHNAPLVILMASDTGTGYGDYARQQLGA